MTFSRTRWFWAGLALIVVLAAVPRLMTWPFSLPYIDHLDEPNYYLAGLEWRGQFDNNNYFNGFPPVYILLQATGQTVLDAAFGVEGIAANTRAFRLLAVGFNLGALVLLALTARRLAGDLAGWLTGGLWGVSALVVEHGIYALPDPALYLLAALTLWLSVEAWTVPARRGWCLWAMAVALLGVLTKYPALPLLAPPGLVALRELTRDRAQGWRLLRWQAAIIALVGVAFAGYLLASDVTSGAWFNYYGPFQDASERSANPTAFNPFATAFNLSWIANNLQVAAVPVGGWAIMVAAAWGLAGYIRASRTSQPTVNGGAVGLVALVVFGTCWAAAGYLRVTPNEIRHVMVASMGLMILFGVATAQGVQLAPQRAQMWAGLGALIAVIVVVGLPQARQTAALVQDRTRPDVRVSLRQWFDANLDAGNVLVSTANDKTFNPIWGGIPHTRWVDWRTVSDFTEHPPPTWITDHGMAYAAIPATTRAELEQSAEGRQFLNDLLPLRTFAHNGTQRGPQMTFYRLWRMDQATNVRFGDHIVLVGHDALPPSVGAGESVTVRLYWQAIQPPPENYSMFLHLVRTGEPTPQAQLDANPAVGGRLTQQWTDPTETIISPPHTLTLPESLPPGDYTILLGLYNFENGVRLPVDNGADSYPLHQLRVEAGTP